MARAVARHQGLVFGDARMSSWRSLFETGAAICGRDSSSPRMSRSVLGCIWEFPEEAQWTCCDGFPRKVSSCVRLLCPLLAGVGYLAICLVSVGLEKFRRVSVCSFFFLKVSSNECNLCNFNLIYRFSLHDLIEIKFSHNAFVTIVKFWQAGGLWAPVHPKLFGGLPWTTI